jgi:hypothetical protein
MVGEGSGANGGSGSGNPPGSGQGAGQGAPAGGAGAGDAGQSGGGSGSNAGAAAGLDRSRLNPMLRGMDEDQLNEVFDTLFSAAKSGRESGVPAHAQETVPKPEAPKLPTVDELKAKFDPSSDQFDPVAAIDQIVSVNYGGLLGDINQRSLSAVEVSIAQVYPDYMEYKADINKVLAGRNPTTISQNDLVGAYVMAKGAKVVQKELEDRKKPPTTRTPSANNGSDEGGTSSAKDDKLTPEMEATARIMFRGSADPIKAFREAEAKSKDWSKMKVPGDA